MTYTDAIEIYMDHVVVFGQRVDRPDSQPRSQWLYFWEQASWVQDPLAAKNG